MVVRDPVRLARGVCNGDKYKFDGKGERERETEGWGRLGWLSERWVAGSERGLPGGSRRGSDGRLAEREARKGTTRVMKSETNVG